MRWVVLAIAVPAVELLSIVWAVQVLGGGATAALLVLAVVVGVLVIRAGVRRLREAARGLSPSASQSPGPAPFPANDPRTWTEPLLMIAAGVLLVVPGFVGDVIGLALLVPGIRLALLALIGTRLARRFPSASTTMTRLRISSGPIVPGQTTDPPQPRG